MKISSFTNEIIENINLFLDDIQNPNHTFISSLNKPMNTDYNKLYQYDLWYCNPTLLKKIILFTN